MANCGGCVIGLLDLWEKVGVTDAAAVLFLQNHGVLLRQKSCPTCLSQCTATNMKFRCQKSYVNDGVLKKCSFHESIKKHTWLSSTNLSPLKVVEFVSLWLQLERRKQKFVRTEMNMSQSSIADWSNFCQEILIDALITSDEVLGGPGLTVEIDEAKFFKRKNIHGGIIDGSVAFGFLERETKRSFMVPVQDRSAGTLIDIISCRIAAGTTIVTDRLKGSDSLANHPEYEHLTVSQSLIFNLPNHTKNMKKNMVDGSLAVYYWNSRYERRSRVHEFFIEVAKQFDPNKFNS